MCLSCTVEELTGLKMNPQDWEWDRIPWPEVTDDMKLLARLRWALYECTSACTGGPMHVFTDDYNVEDSNLEFCRQRAENGEGWYDESADWPLVQAISFRIAELAAPMSPGERATALSLSWGEITVDGDGKVIRR